MESRDEDGNALMSLEEFKEGMFQSIRDSGTVELVRAQLRRRFIEKLQKTQRSEYGGAEGNNASHASRDAESSSSPDEKLVHGLVVEYLANKGLDNTLAVFVPEIGGVRNQVDSATIVEMLHINANVINQLEAERAQTGKSLLLVLVRELVRRFQLATMESETQTAMDCFDHRIVLENQLRRVENTYLAERAAQKLEPQKSLEERMVQYQREYDDICDKRLQEQMEQFKSTEVALVRAEERKRFSREVDSLRATLQQEYRDKQERLKEHERELELAFVARRTELETSLFETRQSLFKDMERLRVKEAELQVKVESDFRHFASETQRCQLWEESVRTQEANLESIVAQAMREKERAWQLERQQALSDIQSKQEELSDREKALTTETGTLKSLKTQVVGLQQEVSTLEAALSKSGDELRLAQNAAVQLEKDKQRLEEKLTTLELEVGLRNDDLSSVNAANARLVADKGLADDEVSRYRQKNGELKEQIKKLSAEVQAFHQQILDLKLEEANAIVSERKKFMKMMEEERDQFQWKENELMTKVHDMRSRLAESEAQAEKYQSQYEDEKVHVESLRRDVANLNSLLTQAQTTISAKRVGLRDTFRAHRGATDNYDTSDYQSRSGSERTFMMKMMEMMANFQDASSQQRYSHQDGVANAGRMMPAPQETLVRPATAAAPTAQLSDPDQEEAKRLKEDQDRIERELLEQREYDTKKKARIEEQERELAEQHQQFEEKLKRMRQERMEEEERIEEQRQRRIAEEEAKRQDDLARQRAALQEASELQQKLAEQRMADEQRRLQEEQAYQEKRLAEEQQFNEELEARRRQQQLEDELATKKKQEREAEGERIRQERLAIEEQQRIQLEKGREKQKEEEDRQRERELREEETRRQKEAEDEAQRREAEAQKQSKHDVDNETETDVVAAEEALAATIQTEHSDENSAGRSEDNAVEPSSSTANLEGSANISEDLQEVPAKTPEEEEAEKQKATEEAKQKEDENVIDVYRQRVLARKAAEKQRQMEQEAERTAKEAEERRNDFQLDDASESDQELELSAGSFAESSAASHSDSF